MQLRTIATVLGVLGIVLSCAGKPTKGAIGAKGSPDGASSVPSASSYVQDGLIALWDGIENVGWGMHDAQATVWKDLVGTHDISIPTGAGMSWGTDYLHRGLAGLINTGVACVAPNYTVEMVVDVSPDNTPSVNGRLFGSTSGSARFEIDIYSQKPTSGPRLLVKRATSTSPSSILCSFGRESFSGTWCVRYSIDSDGFITVSDSSLGKSYRLGQAIDTVYYSGHNLLVGSWTNGGGVQGPLVCNIHCIRIYSRVLTGEEIRKNYQIDKERFGL